MLDINMPDVNMLRSVLTQSSVGLHVWTLALRTGT